MMEQSKPFDPNDVHDLNCPHAEFRVDAARTALIGPCPQCHPEEAEEYARVR